MKKRLALLAVLALALCLTTSCAYLPLLGMDLKPAVTAAPSAGSPAVSASGDTVTIPRAEYERLQALGELAEIMQIIDNSYYEEVDHAVMLEKAAAGLLDGVDDPYTFYYTPKEFQDMWEDDEGEYAGVGIQITANYSTQICTISRVFKNGPAEKAGVKKGDILFQVEDLIVTADTLTDAVSIMRGTPGTSVKVTFLRDGTPMEYELERAKITVNRVSATQLTDEIGYIYLYEFAGDCAKEFRAEAETLIEAGIKGLIIDLRDNPGGWVNDARDIADLFVDQGLLCYLKYKDGSKEYYRTNNGKHDLALVILVNGNSASSSEILTGCLQDRADATVVGTKSYGKGIVQSVVALDSGAGMQVTVAQYFTPNDRAVHKLGIEPDVEAPLPEGDVGDYDFADLKDPQLTKALEVMREKLHPGAASPEELVEMTKVP